MDSDWFVGFPVCWSYPRDLKLSAHLQQDTLLSCQLARHITTWCTAFGACATMPLERLQLHNLVRHQLCALLEVCRIEGALGPTTATTEISQESTTWGVNGAVRERQRHSKRVSPQPWRWVSKENRCGALSSVKGKDRKHDMKEVTTGRDAMAGGSTARAARLPCIEARVRVRVRSAFFQFWFQLGLGLGSFP